MCKLARACSPNRSNPKSRWWAVLGLPAIPVPCGETSAGLLVGLQIAGPAGGEARVLGFAPALERTVC